MKDIKLKNPEQHSDDYNKSYEDLMTMFSNVVENFLYDRVIANGQTDRKTYLIKKFTTEYATHLSSDVRKVLQKNLIAWHREQDAWRLKI